ncbi:MAG TPA: hypothetical protein VI757_15020, partial [Bacteroidia bacterium]|nr:hypothetical protein [Bacteroidia bacterium]
MENNQEYTIADIPHLILEYLKSNKVSLTLFIFCLVGGCTKIFCLSNLPTWKNWELCSLGFTVLYTIYILIEGNRKDIFDSIPGSKGVLVGMALLALIIITVFTGIEYFTRPQVMVGLTITA